MNFFFFFLSVRVFVVLKKYISSVTVLNIKTERMKVLAHYFRLFVEVGKKEKKILITTSRACTIHLLIMREDWVPTLPTMQQKCWQSCQIFCACSLEHTPTELGFFPQPHINTLVFNQR